MVVEDIIKDLESKELPEQIRDIVKYLDNIDRTEKVKPVFPHKELFTEDECFILIRAILEHSKEFRDILSDIEEANRMFDSQTYGYIKNDIDEYTEDLNKIVNYIINKRNKK